MAQATSKLTRTAWWSRRTAQVSTDAAGTVISTDPAASALVKKGDTVTLDVAVAAPRHEGGGAVGPDRNTT